MGEPVDDNYEGDNPYNNYEEEEEEGLMIRDNFY